MRQLLLLALAAGLLLAAGCSTDSPVSTTQGTVRILMTDAPGDYEAVNLVVTQVAIHRGLTDSLGCDSIPNATDGWEILSDETRTYDLLQLRNGVFTTIAEGLVPAGHYTQIRLMIGEGSNVVVDGTAYPLYVPSGMESGFKLVSGFDVPVGGLVELALDFDAARSVHEAGSGRYTIIPTVRVLPTYDVGGLSGTIVPDSTAAWIYAIAGTDTIASTMPETDGSFAIMLLTPGAYDVAIRPSAGYRDTVLAGVTVTAQQVTALGEIVLTPQ